MGLTPRNIFLVFLVLLMGFSIWAEANQNPDWRYRHVRTNRLKWALPLYGGLLLGSASNGTGSRTATGVGLGFDFWKGKRDWSFEIDFLHLSKGFSNGSGSVALSYLQIPLLVRRTIRKNFSVNFGPYLAPFLLSGKQNSAGSSTDVKSQYKGDYGLTLGLRYTGRIKHKLRLGLDVRYNYGFFSAGSGTKLRTFLFFATLEFGLW